MTFRLDKCRTLNVQNENVSLVSYEMIGQGTIRSMDRMETYKYHGFLQSKRIEHTEIKKELTLDFTQWLKNICQTRLLGKNMVKAINTFLSLH